MALTQSQEEILKKIIEAFQNGKRLSDLPMAKGTNPYDLYVEVLDTDGESKKALLAALLPYMEEQAAYGIEFDTAVSSPECTRIGNMSLHRTLPIQSRMRGCLLDDDGKVVEYLYPTDWRSNIRDGSRGQVMVEIPMHYRRFITDGTKRRVMLSEYPLPGYHQVPLCYVSAYEATVYRNGNYLSSVVNTSGEYRGGNNNASLDGAIGTTLGRPAAGNTRNGFRTMARRRKPSSAEWNMMTYEIYKTICWLFVVEYATRNVQEPYNTEPTADGCRQGGLGSGVGYWLYEEWKAFNSNQPVIPCGHTDSLGNRSGVATFILPDGTCVSGDTISVPRYRGLENIFGHLECMLDGVNLIKSSGECNAYVCADPEKFSDENVNGYSHIGRLMTTQGIVREIVFGEGGDILPTIVGGNSTSYFCDSTDYNKYLPDEGTPGGVAMGGLLFGASNIGLFRASLNFSPTNYASLSYGTRLCFIPNN